MRGLGAVEEESWGYFEVGSGRCFEEESSMEWKDSHLYVGPSRLGMVWKNVLFYFQAQPMALIGH